MRIGIITQPLGYNYGGILQNYALQQVLLRLGHSPKTIDYFPAKKWGERIKHIVWSYLHLRKPNKWYLPLKRHDTAKQFIRQNIARTHIVRRYRANTVKRYRFDAIIAGSDQIWRPKYNAFLFDMYFDFAKSLSVKKIVYGASFGTEAWEYDSQREEKCRALIHTADAVSVREKSGIALCRTHFGIDPRWVLDPTLLLEAGDYENICSRVPHFQDGYIAAYLLDMDEQIVKRIESIGSSLNLPMRMCSAGEVMELSIEKWLALFRDAEYIITDSFHGTVFSIIFKKPFIAIGNKARGMSRFQSLLEQFGLEERLSPELSADILLRPIEWTEVDAKKQLLKGESIHFLETWL